jgi:hypothetical protein
MNPKCPKNNTFVVYKACMLHLMSAAAHVNIARQSHPNKPSFHTPNRVDILGTIEPAAAVDSFCQGAQQSLYNMHGTAKRP